jgi:hypothetical protein
VAPPVIVAHQHGADLEVATQRHEMNDLGNRPDLKAAGAMVCCAISAKYRLRRLNVYRPISPAAS